MKLILSERELEIIKQQEYKKGWYDCGVANEMDVNNIQSYMTLPFEGEPKGFNKLSLATAEFRHEHGFKKESNPLPSTCCPSCNEEWLLCSCKQESRQHESCNQLTTEKSCDESVTECQHESDGYVYGYHLKNKCKKCGEFY